MCVRLVPPVGLDGSRIYVNGKPGPEAPCLNPRSSPPAPEKRLSTGRASSAIKLEVDRLWFSFHVGFTTSRSL